MSQFAISTLAVTIDRWKSLNWIELRTCLPGSSFMNEILPETKTFSSTSATAFSSSVLGTGQWPQQSFTTSSNRPN